MFRRFMTIAVFVCSVSGLACAGEKLTLDQEKSKIEFVGSKADGQHEGGFKTFTADAVADIEDPSKGSLSIEIETDSLWSDDEKLTNHLKNPDFFDVRKYPKITFKATKIDHNEENKTVTIVGTMKMLDKEVEVKVPCAPAVTEAAVTIKADFKIDRTKWGMTYGEGKINNDVAIRAVLVFNR
jgi:polyisoprenoid-binding protein YceI